MRLVKVSLRTATAAALEEEIRLLRDSLPGGAVLSAGAWIAEQVRTDLANRRAARAKEAQGILWQFRDVWMAVAARWYSKLRGRIPLEDFQTAAMEEAMKAIARFDPSTGVKLPAALIKRYAYFGCVHLARSHFGEEDRLIRPDGDSDEEGSRWDRIEAEDGDPEQEHQRGQVRTALSEFLRGKPARIVRAVKLLEEFDDDQVSVRSGLSLAEISALRAELAASLNVEIEPEIPLKEAARLLGKPLKAVYSLVDDGDLPARKRDGRWWVRPSELRAFQRTREKWEK